MSDRREWVGLGRSVADWAKLAALAIIALDCAWWLVGAAGAVIDHDRGLYFFALAVVAILCVLAYIAWKNPVGGGTLLVLSAVVGFFASVLASIFAPDQRSAFVLGLITWTAAPLVSAILFFLASGLRDSASERPVSEEDILTLGGP
jgi:hypothetical protein